MPFVPVPNTVLAEVRMQQDGQRVENTLYFEKGAAWAAGDAALLAEALIDWWQTYIAPLTHISVLLREVVVTDLSSATGFQVTSVPDTLSTGVASDEAMPNAITLAISFRTQQRGRSFRGRNFIVGLHDTQVAANTVLEPTLVSYVAAYQNLYIPAGVVSASHVVVSRYSGVDPATKAPIPRAAGVTTPVTAISFADNVVDTQRRRGPSRGQ